MLPFADGREVSFHSSFLQEAVVEYLQPCESEFYHSYFKNKGAASLKYPKRVLVLLLRVLIDSILSIRLSGSL